MGQFPQKGRGTVRSQDTHIGRTQPDKQSGIALLLPLKRATHSYVTLHIPKPSPTAR